MIVLMPNCLWNDILANTLEKITTAAPLLQEGGCTMSTIKAFYIFIFASSEWECFHITTPLFGELRFSGALNNVIIIYLSSIEDGRSLQCGLSNNVYCVREFQCALSWNPIEVKGQNKANYFLIVSWSFFLHISNLNGFYDTNIPTIPTTGTCATQPQFAACYGGVNAIIILVQRYFS